MIFIERLILVTLGAVSCFLFLNYENLTSETDSNSNKKNLSVEERLTSALKIDIELLKIQNEISEKALDIKEIKLSSENEEVLKWLKPNKIIKIGEGSILIEAEIIPFDDDEKGIMAQLSFVDLKSKNKIQEITRSYKIHD